MPKISALTSLAQADVVTTTDVLPIVDATAPATTKKVTVQAMVNAGLATLTTLPSGIVNASLNSVTPSGGTLSIHGSAIVSNRLETQGFQGAFFGNAGGVYTTWGTASPVGDIGTGNVIIGGGSASDFALNVRGANILHLCSGDVSRVAVNASGAAVTGIQTITANSSSPALTVTQNGGGYALIIPGAADQWYGLVGDLDGKHFRFSGTAGTGYALFQTFETGIGATGSFVFQRDGGRVLIGTGTDNGVDKLQVTGSISATGAGTFGVATNPTGAVLYARVASDQNFEVIAPGLSATGSRIFSRNNAGTLAPLELQASIVKLCDASGNLVLSSTAGGAAVTGSISATSLVDISAAGAGRIKFPATQNASADANTLDDYQEATYTGTATGMTTSPTGTVSYTLTGNEATLNLPEITGTSNATTFTVTGMPAEARPASRKTVLGRAQDNGGAIVPVRIDIETTGVLTIYANADAGAFTASGSKTLAECSVTYTRV